MHLDDSFDDHEDLMATQLRLEEDMTQRGSDRYYRQIARAQEKGREDNTAYGKTIITGRLGRLSEAIAVWMKETAEGNASHSGTAYKLIKDQDPKLLAYLTLRVVLGGLSSVRTLQYVGVHIGQAIEDEIRLKELRENERKVYEKLVEGAAKRSSDRNKRMYAARMADEVDRWGNWARADKLHLGVKLLDILMTSVGLVEVYNPGESKIGLKYVRALPETLEWIERKNDITSMMRPVYEPMVIPPRNWTTPFNGGYLSSNIKPITMVKTTNRAYLEELRNIDMPIVYEAINAIQQTAWQINSQVLGVLKHLWDSGSTIAGLPPKEGLPPPVQPHDIATNEESRAEWRKSSFKIHQENLSILGTRISFDSTLKIAKRYESFRRIFFPYQLDFRGRIYAVPHLNPQGPDYQKALLRFANGKPLGPEGWKWLAIHGAGLAGYDKASLEDRVNWVLDNEEEILACAADPYNNRGWCTEMGGCQIHKEKPWQFLAFCFEWAGYCQHGEAFVSKIPVALDGSCSGIQHFSAMLKDELGGAAVNLVPQDLPADVYAQVARAVIAQAEHDAIHGTDDELKHNDEGEAYIAYGTKTIAQQWLKFGINRKVTKRSVMTLAYGSREYGFKDQLMEDILWPSKMAATRQDGTVDAEKFPFSGDGFRAAGYMAKAIWSAVNLVLVKAGEAMKWLQEAAQLAAKEELPVRWTTPVGFPVMQAYPALDARRVKTAIHGKVIYLIMNQEKDHLDKRKQSQGISPNFVHSCDAAHLMLTVVRARQAGLRNFGLIHDSFGTTAGDTEQFFYIVREAFVEMYTEVPVLENFRDELAEQLSEKNRAKLSPLPDTGTLELSRVIESRFCFA